MAARGSGDAATQCLQEEPSKGSSRRVPGARQFGCPSADQERAAVAQRSEGAQPNTSSGQRYDGGGEEERSIALRSDDANNSGRPFSHTNRDETEVDEAVAKDAAAEQPRVRRPHGGGETTQGPETHLEGTTDDAQAAVHRSLGRCNTHLRRGDPRRHRREDQPPAAAAGEGGLAARDVATGQHQLSHSYGHIVGAGRQRCSKAQEDEAEAKGKPASQPRLHAPHGPGHDGELPTHGTSAQSSQVARVDPKHRFDPASLHIDWWD